MEMLWLVGSMHSAQCTLHNAQHCTTKYEEWGKKYSKCSWYMQIMLKYGQNEVEKFRNSDKPLKRQIPYKVTKPIMRQIL